MNFDTLNNIRVLMYHRIIPNNTRDDSDMFAVTEENFRKQIKLLLKFNSTPITFEDCALYLEDKLTLPARPVILTFDDGYRELNQTAVPILTDLNLKAVLFVLGNREITHALWDQSKRSDNFALMSDNEIREARSNGFEIGSHGMNHVVLPDESQEKIRDEITGSKYYIENVLGEEIISFAYPYGRHNDSVVSAVCQSGYRFACGVYTGPLRFGDNLFDIRRLTVKRNTGMVQFISMLMTPYPHAVWIYSLLRNSTVIPDTWNAETDDRMKSRLS